MNGIPFERVFSMSAFEAFRGLCRHRAAYPQLPTAELVQLIVRIDADFKNLDYEAAIVFADSFRELPVFRDGTDFFQDCIEAVILRERMIWAKTLTLGRRKLIQKLSRDEQQCIREAGLLVDPPTESVIAWWDRVASRVREQRDQRKLEQAREAERLSIAWEADRLRRLGIDRLPQWIAVEDNTAGYDVLSFDHGDDGPKNRLIEVKSTVCSPLRFFLTRNEWEQATRFGSSYHFHIWNVATVPPTLYERSVDDIAPHVPTDQSDGKWKNAEIPVGSRDASRA